MRTLCVLWVVLVLSWPAGAAPDYLLGHRHESIMVRGQERTYWLLVPEMVNQAPRPLLLAFHGGGGQGLSMAALSRFGALARPAGWIVCYPDGLNRGWNDGRETARPHDDVAFIRALLQHLQERYSVHPRRIYAAGISNGGFFAGRLASEMPGIFAAVASVAATMPRALASRAPARAVPVLFLHGTLDPLVPIRGGEITIGQRGKILSLGEATSFWVRHNGCAPTPRRETLPNLADDGCTTEVATYRGPAPRQKVLVYTVTGGGHAWPGGRQYAPPERIGQTTRDFSATRVIWDFFQSCRD